MTSTTYTIRSATGDELRVVVSPDHEAPNPAEEQPFGTIEIFSDASGPEVLAAASKTYARRDLICHAIYSYGYPDKTYFADKRNVRDWLDQVNDPFADCAYDPAYGQIVDNLPTSGLHYISRADVRATYGVQRISPELLEIVAERIRKHVFKFGAWKSGTWKAETFDADGRLISVSRYHRDHVDAAISAGVSEARFNGDYDY